MGSFMRWIERGLVAGNITRWILVFGVIIVALMAFRAVLKQNEFPPTVSSAVLFLEHENEIPETANLGGDEDVSSIEIAQTKTEMPPRKLGEPLNPPPVPSHFPAPATPQMGWASARYEFNGNVISPGNQLGQMALVHVRPGESISISLQWPKAVPGATVALEVVDGGRLEDGKLSLLLPVDERGEIAFRFVANRQPGRCQVVARSGMDETALLFWVVNELAQNAPVGL